LPNADFSDSLIVWSENGSARTANSLALLAARQLSRSSAITDADGKL